LPVGGLIQHNSANLPAEEFVPRLNWSEMSESDHFVQFYETDLFLLDSLKGYVAAGLGAGDACIVVATRAHREALEERLKGCELNVAEAMASGQYVSLDAAETLSKFMVDGQPDEGRFQKVVGDILKRAAGEGTRRVRAFGEMVALLWAESRREAAIRLEELWNNLQKTHSFSLFCAYEMSCFGGEEMAEPFGHVCAGHSSVIPAESYNDLTNPDERLRAIIKLQQQARSLQAEIAERKEREERLRVSLISEQMARVEAESANRLTDECLAAVSHELRSALQPVRG
jgi:hypothetical protein